MGGVTVATFLLLTHTLILYFFVVGLQLDMPEAVNEYLEAACLAHENEAVCLRLQGAVGSRQLRSGE